MGRTSNRIKLVIGIPAYNEESAIGKAVARTLELFETNLMVDGDSNDDSGRLILLMMGLKLANHYDARPSESL